MSASLSCGRLGRASILILCLSISGMGIAAFVVKQEMGLPYKVATEELRLLNFENLREEQVKGQTGWWQTPETAAAEYLSCASDGSKNGCANILRDLIAVRPADGRLWLEYAKALVLEGDTDITAMQALAQSYETAPREGWIIGRRISFVVPIWNGLPDELKTVASKEIVDRLNENDIQGLLVQKYVNNPFTRKTIVEILSRASPQQKKWFVWQVQKLVKLPM